ncbi:SgcJ/EcaC family oxidoreductase [Actinomadura welshii]|uniref:SgcJ/EcaC family oxidoreductase n=1 Tax=Actinomadura welshii TaxID=3103817 RepID=UPI0003AD59FE|nr:SgcJ/EcaC family oxidoreductase [Actinomadura madurae]
MTSHLVGLLRGWGTGPYAVMVPSLVIAQAVSFRSTGMGSAGLAVGGLAGLGWALLVGWVTGRIGTTSERRSKSEDVFVFCGVICAAFLCCGGVMVILLMGAALDESSTTHQTLSAMMAPTLPYYIVGNTAMELLIVPAALFLGWRVGRDTMTRIHAMVAAAVMTAALATGCAAADEQAVTVAKTDGSSRPAPASRDQTRAITALLKSIDRSWNIGDAAAFAAHWTSDGTVISPQGRRTEGRSKIREEQAAAFAGPMKGTTHELTATNIRWTARDHAVVDGDAVVSNLRGSDGTVYPPLSAKFTCVCINKHGRWMVTHMVSYTFIDS